MDMLLPLDRQYDSGFGAVAGSFKSAADALETTPQGGGLHGHLPINFLFRHAIELYLKSCIIIMHRRFDIPYEASSNNEPTVPVNGKWKLLKEVHSLAPLYDRLKQIIKDNIDFLGALEYCDWDLPADLDKRIKLIDGMDSTSTFFRYPITKDKPKDKQKSSVQPKAWDEMVSNMNTAGAKPTKAFVIVDDDYNVIESFDHDDDRMNAVMKALKETAKDLCGLHMMTVWKLVERK